MKVNFLKLMYHDRLGKVRPGTVAEIPEHQAIQFLRQGIVEKYETKVIRQEPFTPAGVDMHCQRPKPYQRRHRNRQNVAAGQGKYSRHRSK